MGIGTGRMGSGRYVIPTLLQLHCMYFLPCYTMSELPRETPSLGLALEAGTATLSAIRMGTAESRLLGAF